MEQAAAKSFLRSRLCWQLRVRKSKAHAGQLLHTLCCCYAKVHQGPPKLARVFKKQTLLRRASEAQVPNSCPRSLSFPVRCELPGRSKTIHQQVRHLKQMGLKWLKRAFLTSPILLGYETCNQYMIVGQYIQIEVLPTFLIIYGAHMNILFIIKANILVLIRWPYTSVYLFCHTLSTWYDLFQTHVFFGVHSWSHAKSHTTHIRVS